MVGMPFFFYYIFDTIALIQHLLCLTDDQLTHRSRRNGLTRPVEYLHVQFLFQFANHGTQRGLGYIAYIRRLPKMAALIHCQDIFQLL